MPDSFIDIDRLATNILGRSVNTSGLSRVPVWFGSTLSTNFKIRDAIQNEDFDLTSIEYWKILKLEVNPNQLTLTPSIRIPQANTGAGRVYYNWVDDRGSAIEAYELQMSGQTGNLLPGNSHAQRKLYLWTKLRELTLEPRRVPDPVTEEDTVNEAFLIVQTVGLPTIVLFVGFFSVPITFSESAQNQYNHDWNFTFVVTDMFPRYEEMSKDITFNLFEGLSERILGL